MAGVMKQGRSYLTHVQMAEHVLLKPPGTLEEWVSSYFIILNGVIGRPSIENMTDLIDQDLLVLVCVFLFRQLESLFDLQF